jgi:PAS domain S-box-containing protein
MRDHSDEKSSSKNIEQRWLFPVVIYAIAAIVMGISGYLYYRETKKIKIEETISRLETLNSLKQSEILHWFMERDKDVAFYQNNEIFVAEVFKYLTSQDQNKAALIKWLKQTQLSHGYDIFILDNDTTLHFISGLDSTKLYPFEIDKCMLSINTGKKVFIDIYRRESTNKLFYSNIALLNNARTGKNEACLIFRTNIREYFVNELISNRNYGQNVSYSLVKNEGDSLFFINSQKYSDISELSQNEENLTDSPFAKAIQGIEGSYSGVGFKNTEILASVRKIPNSEWVLVVHVDKAEIEKPLAARRWIIASYILLMLFLFIMWYERYVQRSQNKGLKEQLRLSNELINSREILQTIIQSSPLPIIVFSKENSILIWNNAATDIFGWTYVEILKSENPIFGKSKMNEFLSIRKRLEDSDRFTFDKELVRKDGRSIYLRCWVSKVLDPITQNDNLLFIFDDITERRRIADELRILNESLEQRVQERTIEVAELNRSLTERASQLEILNSELESFTYSVSHDLKAPLRSIQGFTDIVIQEHSTELSEEVIRLLNIVKKNARRMDLLIRDLLDLSKVTRSSMKLKPLDMEEIINNVINSDYSHIRENTSITINPLEKAEGDPVLIHQIWDNLISNAVKYSRKVESAAIEIGGYKEDDKLIYYVKDNGAGFNPEYSNKLFNTFQRLHSSDQFEGTGVGLAIVKRIVTRHGGEVWAEGEEGNGATFYFSLPSQLNIQV